MRRVVYVAAMLPEPGRSVDERARAGQRMTRRGIGRGQTANDDGSTSVPPGGRGRAALPGQPARAAAGAAARLRRQHWRITAEPSPVWRPGRTCPTTYVLCPEDRIIDADWARAAAPRAELVELPGDHSPFLARPAELADLLGA